MPPSSPAHTTQTTEVKLPDWVNKASESNYDLAKSISTQDPQFYQGPRVAAPSDMTTQGYDLIKSSVGQNEPLFQQSTGILSRADADTQPMYKNASDLLTKASGDIDVNKWLNPYRNEVENNALNALERQRQQSVMQGSDAASSANAFGGSRHGITEAVTNTNTAIAAGDLSAKLRAQGWDTATANAFEDQKRLRDTAASWGDLAKGEIAGANTLSGGLLSTATGRQAATTADVSRLMSAGATEQEQRQKEIDSAREQFNEPRQRQIDDLNLRLSALGMSPYGKTETTDKTSRSEGSGMDWATTGLGVFKLLAGLSDKTDKTDIQKLGQDPQSGLDMYAYRYKNDPKTYPKVVGPMAQDIKKKFPGSTKQVGGHLTVKGMLAKQYG